MKRQFTVKPKQSVKASTAPSSVIEVDPDKALDVAVDIMNGAFDDQINGRDEDVEWGVYDSPNDLAEDIPTILYLLLGLEDGEDYQIMNGLSIMLVNEAYASQIETLLA